MATKKKKPKNKSVEMTLWDVVLSYPDLHDPKPYKGKIYYRTDVLMEEDDAQLGKLRAAIKQVKTDLWGADKTEWPEATQNAGNKPLVFNGDERADQKGYVGKRFITASTQTPVPVIGPKGKEFSPQMVKGGMFANVAIRISSWEFDGDQGVSIYLQGVQIDTSKPSLNFGGGKSVKQMFSRDEEGEESESEESEEESEEEEDDKPRGKKKPAKKSSRDDEEEESEESEEESESEEEEEEKSPPKKKKKVSKNFDDDEE